MRKVGWFAYAQFLATAICITCFVMPVWADSPEKGRADRSLFGNGADGDKVISDGEYVTLSLEMQYRTLTIEAGGTLDTAGNIVRVSETLLNEGLITDTECGGPGGSGGTKGLGADPKQQGDPPYCPHGSTTCSWGIPGVSGEEGCAPPKTGRGGDGGKGGGGGSGAWWKSENNPGADADGGDGGDGNDGGDGGGYVLIYAYIIDNPGEIHADGQDGAGGQPAPDSYSTCGAEYLPPFGLPLKDLAGGGGGGGGGGDGGEGGTVEIHYCQCPNMGNYHALGGAGGAGGDGGAGAVQLDYGVAWGGHRESECGGSAHGGEGGGGEHRENRWSENGDDGEGGEAGDNGNVIWIWHPGPYDFNDFNVEHYSLDLAIDMDNESIAGMNIMKVYCLDDDLDRFCFRLDRSAYPDPVVSISRGGGPWILLVPGQDWNWYDDQVTAEVILDPPYNNGEYFYLRVEYAGQPRMVAVGPVVAGFGFDTHGDDVPLFYTVVEPWYAYMWLPVKDDGDNWNCDKATADLSITVPSGMIVVSNGVLPPGKVGHTDQVTYEWSTNYDTAAYLFAIAGTDYHKVTRFYGDMPVELYFWPEPEGLLNPVYLSEKIEKWSRVLDMLALFENLYGTYPFIAEKYGIYQWPKYAPPPLDDKIVGAMEHQTISGQYGNWRSMQAGFPRVEAITAHELSHSWWGNEITIAHWNDMWLKEGLATYSEALWFEKHPYPDTIPGGGGFPTLRRYMLTNHHHLVLFPLSNHDSAYVYDISEPGDLFAGDPIYNRSTWIMHMLRHTVDPVYGDGNETDLYFDILTGFRAAQASLGCATTADFQTAAETVCNDNGLYDDWEDYPGHPHGGEYHNLDWFFGDWVYSGGAPAYRYSWENEWVGLQRYLRLNVRQTQQVWHPSDPIFTMPIDLNITTLTLNGLVESKLVIWNDQEEQEYVFPRDGLVRWIELDPGNWILKRWAIPEILGFHLDLGPTLDTSEPVVALNNRAQAAVSLDSGSNAFMWLAEPYYGLDAGLTDLGTLPDATSSTAYDINYAGQIVGESGGHAFIWEPELAASQDIAMFPLPTGENMSVAHGLNNVGQVVGYAGDDEDNCDAVLWQYNGSWVATVLEGLDGTDTKAVAINNSGQIAGNSKAASGETHAVIWEFDYESGAWVIVEDLGFRHAFDISESGDSVGRNLVGGYAVLWRRTTSRMVTEVQLAAAGSVSYAINRDGQVVGEDNGRAFLWLPEPNYDLEAGLYDLNDLIDIGSCGILKAAWDINDAGQIVGYWEVGGDPTPHVFLMNLAGIADCGGSYAGTPDLCDILNCPPEDLNCADCNGNYFPDECDISEGISQDCQANGIPDECDIASLTSCDFDENGVPDECEWPEICPGDSNCNDWISWEDIDYFVAAMNNNVDAWKNMFDETPTCPFANNDVNGDCTVNWRDIDPFVELINTTCP
ncbi:MAG: hypothetical protein KAY37_09350 [Phycisphaerae bacterium]|nr:hypothetical protein [Phycisphaerae bacterium]